MSSNDLFGIKSNIQHFWEFLSCVKWVIEEPQVLFDAFLVWVLNDIISELMKVFLDLLMFLVESFLSGMLMISMNSALVVSNKLTQWNSSMVLNYWNDVPYDVRKNKWGKSRDCSCKLDRDRPSLVATMHAYYLFCSSGIFRLKDWGSELEMASINFVYLSNKIYLFEKYRIL
jgi:hypothetical protein